MRRGEPGSQVELYVPQYGADDKFRCETLPYNDDRTQTAERVSE